VDNVILDEMESVGVADLDMVLYDSDGVCDGEYDVEGDLLTLENESDIDRELDIDELHDAELETERVLEKESEKVDVEDSEAVNDRDGVRDIVDTDGEMESVIVAVMDAVDTVNEHEKENENECV
jgi:hypothetical protein